MDRFLSDLKKLQSELVAEYIERQTDRELRSEYRTMESSFAFPLGELVGVDIGLSRSSEEPSRYPYVLRIILKDELMQRVPPEVMNLAKQATDPSIFNLLPKDLRHSVDQDRLQTEVLGPKSTNISRDLASRAAIQFEKDEVLKARVMEFAKSKGLESIQTRDIQISHMNPTLHSLAPGDSISNRISSSGTVAAIVYGSNNEPMALSCWHVLAGDNSSPGIRSVSPGVGDGGSPQYDHVGDLVNPIAPDRQGDVAVSKLRSWTVPNPEYKWEPQNHPEVEFEITKSRKLEIKDLGMPIFVPSRVLNSDQIGEVDGIGTYFMEFTNLGVIAIDGFRTIPQSNQLNTELSVPGDSGSLRFIEENGEKYGVGIHFAGEINKQEHGEYAIASHLEDALLKLGVTLTPKSPGQIIRENPVQMKLRQLTNRLDQALHRSGRSWRE